MVVGLTYSKLKLWDKRRTDDRQAYEVTKGLQEGGELRSRVKAMENGGSSERRNEKFYEIMGM